MKSSRIVTENSLGESSINVLLIGNNPIELNPVHDKPKNSKSIKFITEISFNISDALMKIFQFKPNCILVDDNLENKNIKKLTGKMKMDERIRHIPITLLKSSNYKRIISNGIMDFLLKDNLSADKLYRSILNVTNMRRTHLYLYKSYKRSKHKVSKLMKS